MWLRSYEQIPKMFPSASEPYGTFILPGIARVKEAAYLTLVQTERTLISGWERPQPFPPSLILHLLCCLSGWRISLDEIPPLHEGVSPCRTVKGSRSARNVIRGKIGHRQLIEKGKIWMIHPIIGMCLTYIIRIVFVCLTLLATKGMI